MVLHNHEKWFASGDANVFRCLGVLFNIGRLIDYLVDKQQRKRFLSCGEAIFHSSQNQLRAVRNRRQDRQVMRTLIRQPGFSISPGFPFVRK